MTISKRAAAGASTVTATRRGQLIRLNVLLIALFILGAGHNEKRSRSRRGHGTDETNGRQAFHDHRKQKGWRLSAHASG